MLTAKDGDLDEAEALDTGADDYLTKPFSFPVLVARVRSLLRRGTGRGAPVPVERRRPARSTRLRRRAWRATDEIGAHEPASSTCSSSSIRRVGQVVSKREILDGVWQYDFEGDPNIVEVYIRRLRIDDRRAVRSAIDRDRPRCRVPPRRGRSGDGDGAAHDPWPRSPRSPSTLTAALLIGVVAAHDRRVCDGSSPTTSTRSSRQRADTIAAALADSGQAGLARWRRGSAGPGRRRPDGTTIAAPRPTSMARRRSHRSSRATRRPGACPGTQRNVPRPDPRGRDRQRARLSPRRRSTSTTSSDPVADRDEDAGGQRCQLWCSCSAC